MEEITKSREEVQSEAKAAIIESLDLCNKAVVNMTVGLGKTKLTLDILAHYNPDRITWLTTSETLRDVETPKEFIKWQYEHLLYKSSMYCYQTAYKFENQDLGFIVCDEVDFILDSPEYIKSITNNRYSKLLLVSGTYTEDKLKKLQELNIPLVYSITTSEAQSLGILNNTQITFLEFDLNREKTRKIETKTKSWMTSENEQYQYLEGQFIYNIIQYEALKKQADTHYSVARIPGFNYDEFKKKKAAVQMKLKWIASQRAKLLHTLDSSKNIARVLSNGLLMNENNKVIIFSTLTNHLDSFVPVTLHSKNKKGSTALDDFNTGRIRELGAISVLDRGANLVGLNNSIFESYDGSSTKGTQRQGRNLRLDSEDTANIYVLIPYYYTKQNKRIPTRSLAWAFSMFSNYELNDSNFKQINFKDL